MIKKALIRFKTRKAEKSRKEMPITDFASAKRIGILFQEGTPSKEEVVNKMIDNLGATGKEIRTLAFCKNIKKSQGTFPHFDPKGVGISGRFISDELQTFTSESFDFIICLDPESHYLIDHILSSVKAGYRIGVSQRFDVANHLEMIIKPENGKVRSKEILKYLNMIKTSEH